jgi:dTDP-4-dehydrorhamnose 3,5-epimerase
MQIRKSAIAGLVEIFPRVFEDERGIFFESYNEQLFETLGLPINFVQDNQSFSKKGVVRGLHFQKAPFAQGKLVRVITGRVLDVAVDIRPDSPTFGQHEVFELRSETNNIAYIPEGFAHGFVALEDTIFSYKCTNVYNKESESGILWNDPDLGIDWGVENPIVSEKDQILPTFRSLFDGMAIKI